MTKYIPLEELEKAIQSIPLQWVENMGPVFDEGESTISIDELKSKISSIPTIDLSIIDEMIEEAKKSDRNSFIELQTLEELKSRLSSKL